MSTLLDRIAGLPSDPVEWVWYRGYYDGPLSGWIRVNGRRYYYHIINDALHQYRLFSVYHVPRAIRVPHLLSHRRWRQMVGWDHDWRPGEPRSSVGESVERLGYYAYVAEEEKYQVPDLNFRDSQSSISCRGITDLKEVRWLVHPKWDALEEEDR